MKKSVSRKALFASAAALSLSALLFAGTTYAWFTDSASSAASTIQSGNLDIGLEVYSKSAGKYVTVDSSTDLFAAASNDSTGPWEPGHAEVVYLKVSNLGSLTLKYQLTVSKVSETAGKNANGDDIYLSKYLKYGLVNNVQAGDLNSRSAAVAAADTNAKALDQYSDINTLDPKGAGTADQYVALVVYMPETVDNDANYAAGSDIPTIKLGVTAAAVQAVSENDSFGNTYDEKAFDEYVQPVWISVGDYTGTIEQVTTGQNLYQQSEGDQLYTLYDGKAVAVESSTVEGLYISSDTNQYFVSSPDALTEAAKIGEDLVLIGDVNASFSAGIGRKVRVLSVAANSTVNLDLDGSSIDIDSSTGENGIRGATGATLNLSNGTLTANKTSGNSGCAVVSTYEATVNLENITVKTGSGMAVSSNRPGGVLNINNSVIDATGANGAVICTQGGAVNITNSTIIGKILLYKDSSVVLNSGDFTKTTFSLKNMEEGLETKIQVNGGKFSKDPRNISALEIAEGAQVIQNEDNTYEVIPAE
jgi:predicted ribosomally synthesized peptide with SipW-like signal peptide